MRSNRRSTICSPYSFRGENRITNFWILTPFLTLATFGLLVTPAGLIKRGKTPIGIAPYAGLTGLVIALGSTIWLGFYGGPSQIFGGFQIDLFTYFFTGVLLLVSLFVAISSLEFMKGDAHTAPYFPFDADGRYEVIRPDRHSNVRGRVWRKDGRGSVPHVDSRCLRRSPNHRQRSLSRGSQDGRVCGSFPRIHSSNVHDQHRLVFDFCNRSDCDNDIG